MGKSRFFSIPAQAEIILSLVLVFSIAGTLSAQIKMTASEAQVLRTLVKAQAEITNTITSDFTQYKHLDFLANDIESSGKLVFKAPELG